MEAKFAQQIATRMLADFLLQAGAGMVFDDANCTKLKNKWAATIVDEVDKWLDWRG